MLFQGNPRDANEDMLGLGDIRLGETPGDREVGDGMLNMLFPVLIVSILNALCAPETVMRERTHHKIKKETRKLKSI